MARRPVFVPDPKRGLVKTALVEFAWFPGFAVSQKRKCIDSLHDSAREHGVATELLEVSTKSPSLLGQTLSAFNLTVASEASGEISLEAAFQGSKVYAESGQHPELYDFSASDAKRAASTRSHERIEAFSFRGTEWPTEPTTAFYDWLYIQAVLSADERGRIATQDLCQFDGFTDIEFNPDRSLNCQARSCALLVALIEKGHLAELAGDPSSFRDFLRTHGYGTTPALPPEPPEQLGLL